MPTLQLSEYDERELKPVVDRAGVAPLVDCLHGAVCDVTDGALPSGSWSCAERGGRR